MKITVIMLKVLLMVTAVTATAMDTIENTDIAEVIGEQVISDHRTSNTGRNITVGKSRAVPNFLAPCDFVNDQQTHYWPHPTKCNKFIVCAPGDPEEINCAGDLVWSQSMLTCDWKSNTDSGKSPINAGASCQCGLVNVPTTRIVGGREVSPKRKYPWQVGLYLEGNEGFICGGSIISNRWILTAAHCIVEEIRGGPYNNIVNCRKYDSSDKLEVWVGDHDQFTTCDDVPDTKHYTIKEYLIHDDYYCTNNNYPTDINRFNLNDVALLELNTPINFDNLIRPICLPTNDMNPYTGKTATVTGWGYIKDSKTLPSSFLKEVQLEIRDFKNCGPNYVPLTAPKICASSNAVVDMGHCNGDSGGPLSVVENNKHVLVGVVSSHVICGDPDYPGLYTQVNHPDIFNWITGKLTKSPGKMCP